MKPLEAGRYPSRLGVDFQHRRANLLAAAEYFRRMTDAPSSVR